MTNELVEKNQIETGIKKNDITRRNKRSRTRTRGE